MEKFEYLPLGSIVILKEGLQKVVIIGRAVTIRHEDATHFFDYVSVPYPTGLISHQAAYFNHSSIGTVVFEGYRDVDEEHTLRAIHSYLDANPDLVRANPSDFQKK